MNTYSRSLEESEHTAPAAPKALPQNAKQHTSSSDIRVEDLLRPLLTQSFSPAYLHIVNESNQHKVPAGAQTHFKIVLVSEVFTPLSLIQRHRAVYELVNAHLKKPLHALSLHLFTPLEWEKRECVATDSPECSKQPRELK